MAMPVRDWREFFANVADLLKQRTGDGVEIWNTRIRDAGLPDEASLRAWLGEKGITGYAQNMLVMEKYGYPAYLTANADDLIEGQYRDRPALRPILDAILARVALLGEVTIQTRKTYVSLVTPKRTFAAIQPTTKKRVDLGLRLDNQEPVGRLDSAASVGSSVANVRIGLTSVEDVDDEVDRYLRRAYAENT